MPKDNDGIILDKSMDSEQPRTQPHCRGWRGLPRMSRQLTVTRALYQRDLASPSPLSVSIQGAMYLRHHSLTYHLDSLMQSKASQEYQAQGDLGLGIILRHRGLWFGHSVVSDSATPWTAARQAPLSMGFSRQEH